MDVVNGVSGRDGSDVVLCVYTYIWGIHIYRRDTQTRCVRCMVNAMTLSGFLDICRMYFTRLSCVKANICVHTVRCRTRAHCANIWKNIYAIASIYRDLHGNGDQCGIDSGDYMVNLCLRFKGLYSVCIIIDATHDQEYAEIISYLGILLSNFQLNSIKPKVTIFTKKTHNLFENVYYPNPNTLF